MPRFLHLVKPDSSPLAAAVAARNLGEPGGEVTVVLLAGAADPSVPQGVAVKRLGVDLDYGQLLDLIFASDHVVTW
jgi:hypothetical protein